MSLVLDEPADPDLRTRWEAKLIAWTFCELSAGLGLDPVRRLRYEHGAEGLDAGLYGEDGANRRVRATAAARQELERRVQLAVARTGAALGASAR